MSESDPRVREIRSEGRLIAHVYDLNHDGGMTFPTEHAAEMQCGFGIAAVEKTLRPHVHKLLLRQTESTSEFILVLSGAMHVDFYDPEGRFVETARLGPEMALLQFIGGHGFKVDAGTKYIEVKQGPYYGESADKVWI
jgi:hypothetical protein